MSPERQPSVVITGAAGFVGSALTVRLSRDYRVFGIDRRLPTAALIAAAPGVQWIEADISDRTRLMSALRGIRAEHGSVDFVLHYAAFYHFGLRWLSEYERTNVEGTRNVIDAAAANGVNRLIFASSLAAMKGQPPGTLASPDITLDPFTPYGKSKAMGEEMLGEARDRVRGISLRMGGVFTDWAELPPLSSLVRLWAGRGFDRRLIPGLGLTCLPYIYRRELTALVEACLRSHENLQPYEILTGLGRGGVTHNELFEAIAREIPGSMRPVHVSPGLARAGLTIQCLLGAIVRNPPFEQPWMLRHLDLSWAADNTATEEKIDWKEDPSCSLLARVPAIVKNYRQHRKIWENRNHLRNTLQYQWHED